MINNELEKLKSLTMEQFKSIARDVDETTNYYASKKEEFDAVIEEGDTVANDIWTGLGKAELCSHET